MGIGLDLKTSAEERQRRYDYWSILKKLRNEMGADLSDKDFVEEVAFKHGFRIEASGQYWLDDYTVINEQKFLLFRLKYGL